MLEMSVPCTFSLMLVFTPVFFNKVKLNLITAVRDRICAWVHINGLASGPALTLGAGAKSEWNSKQGEISPLAT